MTILVDHNLKGQALLLWGTLAAEGWFTLLPLRLATFEEVGLPVNSSDRAVLAVRTGQPYAPTNWESEHEGTTFIRANHSRRKHAHIITRDHSL